MLIIKILYILALAVSGGLILLSDKYPFMVLFVLLLIFPVLAAADLLLTFPFIGIKGKTSASVSERNADNKLHIEIRSLLPIFDGILVIKMYNNLTERSSRQRIHFSTLPILKKKITLRINPDHCGVVDITAEKLIIRDIFGLFRLSKRPKLKFRQYILPKRIPVDLEKYLEKSNIRLDEDKFSEEKSGDDVSEIFGIREYREGDRYRQIHHKLSAKRGMLISKEYSLPIDKELTIVCSPFFDSLKSTEHFYNRVYSLSCELIENNIKHTILFKTKTNSIPTTVTEEKDITDMACVLISLKPAVAEGVSKSSLYIDGRG